MRAESRGWLWGLAPAAIFIVVCGLGGLFSDVSISGEAAATGRGFTEDPRRLIIFGLTYVWALIWLLWRFGEVMQLARRIWLLWLLLAYAAASMLWSPIPFKVFINCGHYAGQILIALAAVCAARDDLRRLGLLLVATLGIVVAFSVVAVRLGWPNSLDIESGRWAGVASNANTLGCISALLLGAAMNVFLAPGSWFIRLGSGVLVAAAALTLRGSGSATSLVMALVMTSGIVWLQFGRKQSSPGVAVRVVVGVLMLCLVGGVAVTFLPETFQARTWLTLLGKSETLTGRTDLWAFGWNLFLQRPWLGYGFDSLASVIGGYGKLGHLHNGYLDLLVRGGIVAIAIYLVVLVRAINRLLKLTARAPEAAFWLMLIVGDMAFELAEASLVRPVNILWLVFLIAAIVAENGALQRTAKSNDARVRAHDRPMGGVVAFPNLLR